MSAMTLQRRLVRVDGGGTVLLVPSDVPLALFTSAPRDATLPRAVPGGST